MRGAFRLGRLFGIDVNVDLSWIFVFLLMSWNLTSIFRGWHPRWLLGPTVFLGVVATLLFFGSVILHELAHAMVARSFGLKVRQIRLFLFGGVSDIESEPPSPRAELSIAIVGPLTSFALAAIFMAVAAVFLRGVDRADPLAVLAGLSPLATILVWLAPVNLTLGLFNLVPAFPLDGGRVLRAILWGLTGNLHRATFAATITGRTIGWAFVAAGIAMALGMQVPFFGTGAVGGVWLVFIGLFLTSAARRTFEALVVEEGLQGVHVDQLMRRTGSIIQPNTPVGAAMRDFFMQSSEHSFPVVEDGKLLGLISVEDVRRLPQTEWEAMPVGRIMTPQERLRVVSPTDAARDAIAKLGARDVEQLPVLDGRTLVGMLSRRDVARWFERLAEAKRSASHA